MTKESAKRTAATRPCPLCGHEAWPIIYGMVLPDTMEQYPKAEFAGCVVLEELRIYPSTGKVESGVPEWSCQNPACGHRWW
jgi:hypothetical protein